MQRKSLISAANCGAQDQIKSLLLDPNIDVNEQSAKVRKAPLINIKITVSFQMLVTFLRGFGRRKGPPTTKSRTDFGARKDTDICPRTKNHCIFARVFLPYIAQLAKAR